MKTLSNLRLEGHSLKIRGITEKLHLKYHFSLIGLAEVQTFHNIKALNRRCYFRFRLPPAGRLNI
jgi:hypothetical protein